MINQVKPIDDLESNNNHIKPKSITKVDDDNGLIYDYNSRPPWTKCIVIGFQHFLTMCLPNATATLIVLNMLCASSQQKIVSRAISASFFCMGITTFLQTIFGTRLPIIQGATFSLIVPALASFPEERIGPSKYTNCSDLPNQIAKISASIALASLTEIVLAFSGLLSLFIQFISPLSLATIFMTLALAVIKVSIDLMSMNWPISILSSSVMLVLVLVLAPIQVPWCSIKQKKLVCIRSQIFQFSPIIMAIGSIWLICGILTITNVFSKDSSSWQYSGRVDSRFDSFVNVSWFEFPLTFNIDRNSFEPGMVISFSIGILISIIESMGDYMVTSRVCNAPKMPKFAINRGIMMEGFGVLLSGLSGSVVGPTSYSDNIGLIKVTKVGNRHITQVASLLMLICGLSPIIGALFNSIPVPIVGGVGIVVSFMILGVGAAYLQHVELNSSRNTIIFSCAVGFGVYLPIWLNNNTKKIAYFIPNQIVVNIVRTLVSSGMISAAFFSILLDNIIPGTYKKIQKPSEEYENVSLDGESLNSLEKSGDIDLINKTYDNFLMKFIVTRIPCLQKLPISATYPSTISNKTDIFENTKL